MYWSLRVMHVTKFSCVRWISCARTSDHFFVLSMHPFIKELLIPQEQPCVTLYVTFQAGQRNVQANRTRLHGLVDQVQSRLPSFALSHKGESQFLAPIRSYADGDLEYTLAGGTLALFLSPSSFHA